MLSTANWKGWPHWKKKALLERLKEKRVSSIWKPYPGPQTLALESPADILWMGGASGGGKTEMLIGAALTRHKRSIIFRKEFNEIEALESRVEELYGSREGYNGQKRIWRLGGDKRLEFGAVSKPGAQNSYRGRGHDLKSFDELCEFTEGAFRFLCGWLRTPDPTQRTRVICTGNPPVTEEQRWVIRFWAPWVDKTYLGKKAEPGELRWYVRGVDESGTDFDLEVEAGARPEKKGEHGRWYCDGLRHGAPVRVEVDRLAIPKSRTFIPGTVEDNQVLMATGYDQQLLQLPEPLRSALRYGKFDAYADEDPWQVIPSAWVRLAQDRWRNSPRPDTRISAIGVDPSRGGDETVLSQRYGTWFAEQIIIAGKDAADGPAVARHIVQHRDVAPVHLDVIGVGYSVLDILLSNDIPVIALNGANSSTATDRSGKMKFRNKRAQWYWEMREALDPDSGHGLSLPPDPQLASDLCSARWKLTAAGIQIEDKQGIKLRLGRSPDRGDALIYALAESSVIVMSKDLFMVA